VACQLTLPASDAAVAVQVATSGLAPFRSAVPMTDPLLENWTGPVGAAPEAPVTVADTE
jgi:hypothetical protein